MSTLRPSFNSTATVSDRWVAVPIHFATDRRGHFRPAGLELIRMRQRQHRAVTFARALRSHISEFPR